MYQDLTINIYSLVNAGATLIVFSLAFFVLKKNPFATINKFFSAYAFAVGLWALSETVGSLLPESRMETALLWRRLGSIGGLLFPPLFFLFILAFTKNHRILNNFYTHMLLMGISLGLYHWAIFLDPIGMDDIARQPWGWEMTHMIPSLRVILLWSPLPFLAGIYLLWKFYRHATDAFEKRQTLLVLIATVIPFIFGALNEIVVPFFGLYQNVTPVLFSLSSISLIAPLAYASVKYRLFTSITPSAAADTIIDTMKDALMVTNENLTIEFVNVFTLRLLGLKKEDLAGKPLASLFSQKDNEELARLTAALRKKEEVSDVELTMRVHGEGITVLLSASLLSMTGGVHAFVFVARDIRESKKLITNLQETTEQLRNIKYQLERKIGQIIE